MGIAVIPLLLIIAAIAIPNLLRAKMAANEASAVGDLRSYHFALGTYAAQCPQIGFPTSLMNLGFGPHTGADRCERAGLVDNNMGSEFPIRFGYTYHYVVGPPDSTGRTTSFALSAEPVRTGNTGNRSFFVDQTGVVRVSSFGRANIDSPPL